MPEPRLVKASVGSVRAAPSRRIQCHWRGLQRAVSRHGAVCASHFPERAKPLPQDAYISVYRRPVAHAAPGVASQDMGEDATQLLKGQRCIVLHGFERMLSNGPWENPDRGIPRHVILPVALKQRGNAGQVWSTKGQYGKEASSARCCACHPCEEQLSPATG